MDSHWVPAEDVLLRAVDAQRDLRVARAGSKRTTNREARLDGCVHSLCEAVWIMSGRQGGYATTYDAVLATVRERPDRVAYHPMTGAETAERLRREHQAADLDALRRHLAELGVALNGGGSRG